MTDFLSPPDYFEGNLIGKLLVLMRKEKLDRLLLFLELWYFAWYG